MRDGAASQPIDGLPAPARERRTAAPPLCTGGCQLCSPVARQGGVTVQARHWHGAAGGRSTGGRPSPASQCCTLQTREGSCMPLSTHLDHGNARAASLPRACGPLSRPNLDRRRCSLTHCRRPQLTCAAAARRARRAPTARLPPAMRGRGVSAAVSMCAHDFHQINVPPCSKSRPVVWLYAYIHAPPHVLDSNRPAAPATWMLTAGLLSLCAGGGYRWLAFPSDSVYDDLAWAGAWLFRATGGRAWRGAGGRRAAWLA
jgi:hypothetical protein